MAQAAGGGEILIEFKRIGNYLKVIALHAPTLTEVSVFGPAVGSKELLKRTALAKLDYVMKRGQGKPPGK
ncbi:hypothetical protein WCLP8_4840002 [uncultured Gammaproteobacteria bacterium]